MTQQQALNVVKTGANVFLTGEPGAGKTYLINQYIAYLRGCGVEPAVTASTGIAATHIGGMTIHSWSGIGIKESFDKYDLDRISSIERIAKRILRTSVLIIDEISMLSATTLSMVEAVCREVKDKSQPFGGLQVIFIGDFFQLPPVVRGNTANTFAYNSPAWIESKLVTCYLTEQHRQEDANFLQVLSAIRRDSFNEDHLELIASRKADRRSISDTVPRFFAHNAQVDTVNSQMLGKLPGKPISFAMAASGRKSFIETLKKSCLSPENLELKIGSVVMFTKNNSKDGFANGTLGIVEEFDDESSYPIVRTKSGRLITVGPADWVVEENGRVRAQISQLPLRLAWAITIHKSQGMSMDAAAMDLSNVFEYGQGYVALSRVRTLDGLYLFGWNAKTFMVHPEILAQDELFRKSSDVTEEAIGKLAPDELVVIQEKFIASCGGKAGTQKANRNPDGDTYLNSLSLWNEGKTPAQIAAIRELKESTILSHIEKLFRTGKIAQPDLDRILTVGLKSELAVIHAAFRELSEEKLSPVFAKFAGRYTYDQLRIARMLYKK